MRISQIMQRSVVSITPETSIREASRLIFELSVSGLPVLENEKMVGIVTESDILRFLQPSLKDIVDGGESTIPTIENSLKDKLDATVSSIMTKDFHQISPDEPVVSAQSTMFSEHCSHLPVISSEGKLVGILSQGDIFRELLHGQLKEAEAERYAKFVADHYDIMVNWENRLDFELPVLLRQFRKLEAKRVIDVGSWTGEYAISLVLDGINDVLALDHNKSMVELSEKKIAERLTPELQKHITAKLTDFTNLTKLIDKPYDVAICMGNSLPFIPAPLPVLLEQLKNVLKDENGAVVFQVLNHVKLLKSENRLISFKIQDSTDKKEELMFLEFFDPTDDEFRVIQHTVAFRRTKPNTDWVFTGTTSVPLYHYTHDYITEQLEKFGFKRIIVAGNSGGYQGEYGQLSFHEPFNPDTSDWLNIVAVKR